jgi:hypothetical protein
MKTVLLIFALASCFIASAQKIKPCESWLSGFAQTEPKTVDGIAINKYVAGKLSGDTSLRPFATCMVGLIVYANCKGELSYEKQDYRNNPSLASQCATLLKKTEQIINGLKTVKPATVGGSEKDLIFKLVVKVKHNGKPVAEILY